MRKLTYKQAGVDIAQAAVFKQKLKGVARKSFSPEVLKDIGGFGSLFRFPKGEYDDPVLVSSSDGVGTKLKIAVLADKHDTIGIDVVAMNINDILCVGAKPLFLLDYIAYSKLNQKTLLDIVKGINRGCIEAGCSLIGGETAQMPGMYKDGDYDLAGFCVGVVERRQIIDGAKITPGDVLVGLASSGIHSNGYSLVRRVLSQAQLKRLGSELLKPTRIYANPVLSLLYAKRSTLYAIHGISHITGGAFYDKIKRILPDNCDAIIRKDSWPVSVIFKLIQIQGNVPEKEMYHTFNMGVGMVLIVSPQKSRIIQAALAKFGLRSWVIGEVVKGYKQVEVI